MTEPLTPVDQHAEVSLLKLAPPWWGKPRIGAWLVAYARQWQALEDALWQQLEQRSIDAGDDERLRIIGELIGQPRHGFATELYRKVLRARGLANRSRGTGPDLGRVFAAVLGSLDFVFTWLEGASLLITSLQDTDSEDARAVAAVVPFARGAGVSVQFAYLEDASSLGLYNTALWGHVTDLPVSFVSAGALAAGGGALAVAWGAGHVAGDLGVLTVATANETFATPSGWTLAAEAGVGAIGTTGVRIRVFWRFATSGAEASASVADSGQHQIANIVVYRGVFAVEAAAALASADVDSATVTAPSVTTLGVDRMLVTCWASATNGSTIGSYSAPIANERFESGFTGSTISIADGVQAAAGASGTVTATLSIAARSCAVTLALAPFKISDYANVVQA